MAVQSNLYDISETRTYHSTKPIATKQHMVIWLRLVDDGTLPVDQLWTKPFVGNYDLINNSAVFKSSFNLDEYTHIEVRVADTPDELLNSPSVIGVVAAIAEEIIIVAGIADEVVAVADIADSVAEVGSEPMLSAIPQLVEEPLKTAILNAEYNATKSQTESWESEARAMTSASFANEPLDVHVKEWFSNGDGTFRHVDTTYYSAFHWSEKAKFMASGLEYMGIWDASAGVYPPDGTELGQFYVVSVNGTIDDGSGEIPWNVGDWMIWDHANSNWSKVGWSYDWSSIANIPINVLTSVGSDVISYGGTSVSNIVTMTSAEYEAISPEAGVIYGLIG